MKPRSSSSGLIFLTTLIDLLMQIVFLMLLIALPARDQGELLNKIKSSGLTIDDLQKNWRRLVDIDSLNEELIAKQRQNEEGLKEKEEEVARLKTLSDDLRAQNDALRAKSKASGGRDLPPCWVKNNDPEYLLFIQIREDGMWLKPMWEPYRDMDADTLGLNRDQLEGVYTAQQFRARFGHLRQQQSQAGKCNHYVLVTDDLGTSKNAYKQHLSLIESIFYKKLFNN